MRCGIACCYTMGASSYLLLPLQVRDPTHTSEYIQYMVSFLFPDVSVWNINSGGRVNHPPASWPLCGRRFAMLATATGIYKDGRSSDNWTQSDRPSLLSSCSPRLSLGRGRVCKLMCSSPITHGGPSPAQMYLPFNHLITTNPAATTEMRYLRTINTWPPCYRLPAGKAVEHCRARIAVEFPALLYGAERGSCCTAATEG